MSNTPTNCPLLTQPRFRPECPTEALKKQGRRCLEASNRVYNGNTSQLDHGVTSYLATGTQTYFSFNQRYITRNNLSDAVVLAAFLRAVQLVQTCLATHAPAGLNDYEVVIVLGCISNRSFKFYYYIANHESGTVQWPHRTPTQVSSSVSVPMRREAEYWYHRSCFTVHRPCTQDDRNATIALLESLPIDVASRTYVRDRLDSLRQTDASNITSRETFTIAQIRADTLEMSLPEMQNPRRSTMLKAFHGLKQFKTKWFYHPSVHGDSPAGSPRGSQADN